MKLYAPIKGIFFDIGWTLSYPITKDWWVNKKMIEFIDESTYISISKDRKDIAFGRAIKYLDDNHYVLTEEGELKQFETFYSILANDLPELQLNDEKIKAIAYYRQYSNNNILFDDTIQTLEALKGKYKLGVISDTWPSVLRNLKNHDIDKYFDTKTLSCFLGTFKPNKLMYLHALEQMKLAPEYTLFIDDSIENLNGAEKCGIQCVLITAKPEAEKTEKYISINKLSELLDVLP